MRPLTTPQILWAAIGAVWLAALLLTLVVIGGARDHRRAMQTLVRDTVPTIVASQRVKAAVADMDANGANQLVGGTGENSTAVKLFDLRRKEAEEALEAASENIAHGDAERKPIETIAVALTQYCERIQQARDMNVRLEPRFVFAYYQGSLLIDNVILPAADELERINLAVLERSYSRNRALSAVWLFAVVLFGFATVATLVWLQLFLLRRMNRLINPLLAAATSVALLFLLYSLYSLLTESRQLRIAKEDAFTSLHALWRARAIAYGAYADETRYLFRDTEEEKHRTEFYSKIGRLLTTPQNATMATLRADMASGAMPPGYRGFLVDEMRNITFPGEREAAQETLARWIEFVAADQKVRDLERTGQHSAAIAQCLGEAPGQSVYAFGQFDSALGKTVEINQRAFDQAAAEGLAAVRGFEWLSPLVGILVSLLALFGVLPRIREYR